MLLDVPNTCYSAPLKMRLLSRPHRSANRVQSPPVKWWRLTRSKQMPSLLQQVTENKSLDQNDDMVIDEPEHAVAGSSTCPVSILDNTGVLPYEDELDLST